MGTHGFRYAHLHMVAAPRTDSPPPPSGGSRLTERVQTSDRWWERAACQADEWRGRAVWIEPHKHPRKEVAAALAVCERCPVRAECAADDRGWCIQGGVAHISKPAETKPRPKRQLICERCAVLFTGMSRKFCSDGCRRAYHRDKQRKAVQTANKRAATLGGHTSDPGAAGNGPGSDRKPLGGPR